MAPKKAEAKRIKIPLIENLDEANTLLEKIAASQRALDTIRIELDEEIAKLQAAAVEKAEPFNADMLLDSLSVAEFAERNRADLVKDEKSIKIPAGTFGWRTNPPSVSLKDVEQVIGICERRKLEDFLRRKVEVNKAAMLANPELAESVQGVTIKTGVELFFVKTNEAEVCIDPQKQKFMKAKKDADKEE